MISKNSQILPFMILIMVVLMLAIAATYVIGEAGFQKVRLINVLDGVLISKASELCRSLNMVRQIHNAMFLNYLSTQVAVLTVSFDQCPSVYAKVFLIVGSANFMNGQLASQAEEVVEKSADSLRQDIYDACLGNLVDEPTPFLESEIIRDARGRIVGINHKKYLERVEKEGTVFENKYLEFKKTHPDNWYKYPKLAYYFNKSKQKVLEREGTLLTGDHTPNYDYESYVKVDLQNAPTDVDISTQTMPLIFFCLISAIPIPQVLPFPNAWIKKVKLDTNYIEAGVEKYISFKSFSLFPKEVTLSHTARARIRGSIWRGYDFVLER